MPPVGKTTLAVHFAHQVAGRFGDGQLYVNLRGFDPAGPPMTPGEAIRIFLEALGVAATSIPAGLDAQTALYRSLLAAGRCWSCWTTRATSTRCGRCCRPARAAW